MPIFFDRLTHLIKQAGMTQARFAADIGITPQAVSYYAKGREPSFELLRKIAEYFHVTTDYLLGASPSESVSIKNYGDVANTLLAMINQGTLGFFADEPEKDCPQVSFSIPKYECNAFFLEYSKMSKLYTDGSISSNVFGTWLGAELVKLQAFPLPETFVWENGAWVPQNDQTYSKEGSHGLDQETDH